MSDISRRQVAKGAAWSVPAVSIAAASPSVAASSPACSLASKTAIDNRLKVACADSKLTFNIYQPIAQLSNSTATTINLNLRNDGACNAYFSCSDPLIVKIQIHDINPGCQRSITSKGTSWGTLTNDGYDSANHLRNFTWSFCGEIPAKVNGDNEADLQIGLGDGAFCGGAFSRQTSYLTFSVPMLKPPTAPEITTILKDSTQQTSCLTYYNTAAATYIKNSKVNFYYAGPLASGGPVSAGQVLDSRTIGNYSSVNNSTQNDGIW